MLLESFLFAFNAVVPMLLLMLLGAWLKETGFFEDAVIKKMNTFAFRYGISFMMFQNIYTLTSIREIRLNVLGFVMVSLVALTAIGWVEGHLFTNQRNRRGVIMQNSFRSNFAIIGTTLAISLGGAEGGAISASMQAPAIIYYNVMAVLCLTIYSDRPDRAVDVRGILKKLVTNPMILGQVAGLICLVLREFIPRDAQGELVFSLSGNLPFLYTAIDYLATMATPLILVLLGAQVNFSAVGSLKKELILCVTHRLVLAPAAGFAMAFAAQALGVLAVTPALLSSLVGMYGTPAAAASGIMAGEIGGDAELACQLVVWTAAFSMGTLFLWIFGLHTVGLL